MTRIALASGVFVGITNTSPSRFYRAGSGDQACSDPQKREFLAAIGIVRRTTRPTAFTYSEQSPSLDETSVESLSGFAAELGLAGELEKARRELSSLLDPSGRSLKALRLNAGFSQQALAERLGTSQSRISAIEAGRDHMSLGFAKRMANALGVSVDRVAEAAGKDD